VAFLKTLTDGYSSPASVHSIVEITPSHWVRERVKLRRIFAILSRRGDDESFTADAVMRNAFATSTTLRSSSLAFELLGDTIPVKWQVQFEATRQSGGACTGSGESLSGPQPTRLLEWRAHHTDREATLLRQF